MTPDTPPALAFRAVSDLADAFDPDTLTAMQHDAAHLAARGDQTAGAWQALADALGAACALAEHDRATLAAAAGTAAVTR